MKFIFLPQFWTNKNWFQIPNRTNQQFALPHFFVTFLDLVWNVAYIETFEAAGRVYELRTLQNISLFIHFDSSGVVWFHLWLLLDFLLRINLLQRWRKAKHSLSSESDQNFARTRTRTIYYSIKNNFHSNKIKFAHSNESWFANHIKTEKEMYSILTSPSPETEVVTNQFRSSGG